MDIPFSIDLISDLNLADDEELNWEGKPTSLFCAVAGGISGNLKKVHQVLSHLGSIYRGVLYIDGKAEHHDIHAYETRIQQLKLLCEPIPNVIYLHNHVIILNGVAFVAINGWYNSNYQQLPEVDRVIVDSLRIQDMDYLNKTIRSLQHHHESKRICVISSSLPSEQLTFKDPENDLPDPVGIIMALLNDTNNKVDHWLFGSYNKIIDGTYNNRRYVNNPKFANLPYYPKRIALS